MKAVILAGGLGTRISEETDIKPKPMIEIGGKPIIWHIMKMYSMHGINDFIICCGYKGYVIKEYFSNYSLHQADLRLDFKNNTTEILKDKTEPWTITLVDTGLDSMTGGRLRRVRDYLGDDDSFCFTYGDGVSDIDITASIAFHEGHGKLATLAAVNPPGRFGALSIDGHQISSFVEKPRGDGHKINGGFFVLSTKVIDFIEGDGTTWEKEPLAKLAKMGQLMAYGHNGFWQPMDTLRDKTTLNELWSSGHAAWKTWE
ncbi:glucose-1-phosphate cytidylyltransferase [Porticoccaceae bacterium]|nr:glucose-1-phosphate cytidylyltransferase [Porticoccaceae bacterium]